MYYVPILVLASFATQLHNICMASITPDSILEMYKLRSTELRKTILSFFLNASKPLSVPELQETLKSLGLDANKTTLYRQVELFTQLGIIKELHLEQEKTHYEMAAMDHHHHLICNNCQKIEHIEVPSIEEHVENLEMETKNKTGFNIVSHTLEFYGLCKKCMKLVN